MQHCPVSNFHLADVVAATQGKRDFATSVVSRSQFLKLACKSIFAPNDCRLQVNATAFWKLLHSNFVKNCSVKSQVWWFTPIIPVTQEAVIRRRIIGSRPAQGKS
jgi:hypothetical protein